MRITLENNISSRNLGTVLSAVWEFSCDPDCVVLKNENGKTVVEIPDNGLTCDTGVFLKIKGVESVDGIESKFQIVSSITRTGNGENITANEIDIPGIDVTFGGNNFVVMAGPCAVEDEATLLETAKEIKRVGISILRGGAFKPRTSPYSFQGLGSEGLRLLARVKAEIGIGIITEAMEPGMVDEVAEVADIIQVGSRNMHSSPLLKAVGKCGKPVLLKRGMSATLEEWLGAAEYILSEGNPNVILCERGIRTFSRHSRHTLDLGVIPSLKERCALPVIVDPSHATGSSARVPSMARAALAAGADGLLLEIHPEPSKALSDGFQALNFKEFEKLMDELRSISVIMGKTI